MGGREGTCASPAAKGEGLGFWDLTVVELLSRRRPDLLRGGVLVEDGGLDGL